MKISFISVFFLTVLFGHAQGNSELISLKDYYRGESVIFKKDYTPLVNRSNFKESFTPTKEQIKEVEKMLIAQYNSSKVSMVDSLRKKNPNENLVYPKPANNVKRKLCKYKRQYFGYIAKTGDTIISVNLLNFKNKRKANKYFSNWKTEYVVGFDGFYYDNMEYFNANLTKNKLIVGN
ncbi:hypothetical protein [Spongiimicrobium sp. 3-5]|uniref:hypothetical protein n=1 Tax=Spongiimicrobium sp. 3-5 TaxID=3332596 RepID=UPI003980F714